MNRKLLFVFVLIAILVLFILRSSNTHGLEWKNNRGIFNPVQAFTREVDDLGPPDLLDHHAGGLAIWRTKTLRSRNIPLVEIMLRDESVPHASPAPHNDFLYATYKIKIAPKTVYDVLRLSESITYDALKHEVTTRCHFMGANYATLYLITLLVDGTLGFDVAKNMFGPTIMQTIPSHETFNANAKQAYITHLTQRLRS